MPKYEIKFKNTDQIKGLFNPLLGCADRIDENSNKILNKYKQQLEDVRSLKDYEKIQKAALIENVEIHNNNGFIAQAERQSVNARVQGGSATLTKLAMINIDRDPRLQELGFELLITVHDEVIGQCPIANAEEAAKILSQIMIDTAAQNNINIPMKCDATIVKRWYEDEQQNALEEEYKHYVEGNADKNISPMSNDDAFKALVANHEEMLESELRAIVNAL